MTALARRCLLAASLWAAPLAAGACILPHGLMLDGGGYAVSAVPDPAPIEIGRPFSLTLTLCTRLGTPLGRIVSIDAQMPAHRHGMNYAPRLMALDGGQVRADGLMLHMPGLWRLTVGIEAAGTRELLSLDLTLE